MTDSHTNKTALMAMCLGIFIVMLDTTIMNIALPEIQTSLSASLTSVSWALNAYTIIFASTSIPLGKLANIYGKKRFFIIALVIFGLGSLLSGISHSVGSLILGRLFQSFGAAVIFPLSMDLAITTQSDLFKRKATLFVGITQGIAAAFGPTIGGLITQFMGWRWIFMINIPIALIALLMSIHSLPNNLPVENTKIDWIGSLLTVIGLVSLTLALIQLRFWGWNLPIYALFSLFIISGVLFYFWEKHVSVPMINFGLFKNANFDLASVATLFGQLILVGFMVIMPIFLSNIFDKTAFQSALLITPATFMIFILSPFAGFLVRKTNPKKLLAIGFIALGAGYLGFSTIGTSLNYLLYVSYCLLIGAGYGVIVGPISVLSTAGFQGSDLTASQSVIGVLRQLGTVLAVAIFVSALGVNISHAKQKALSFSEDQIRQTAISKSQRSKTLNEIKRHLNNQQGIAKSQSGPVVSQKQKREMIQQQYQAYLTKKGIQEEQLPASIRRQIKATISKKVIKSVGDLNNVMVKIKREIAQQFVTAFTKLYQYATPLIFLIALCFWLVPVKPISLRSR